MVHPSVAEVVLSGLAMHVLGGTTAAPMVATVTAIQISLAKLVREVATGEINEGP